MKEAVVSYFEILSQHLPGGTDEEIQPRLDPVTFE